MTFNTSRDCLSLKTLLEQGEAEVKLGGCPFKMRRSFVDDLSSQDRKATHRRLRRASPSSCTRRRIARSTSTTRRKIFYREASKSFVSLIARTICHAVH